MAHNRTGLIPADKWNCMNCGQRNDPETEACFQCGADTDGFVPFPPTEDGALVRLAKELRALRPGGRR